MYLSPPERWDGILGIFDDRSTRYFCLQLSFVVFLTGSSKYAINLRLSVINSALTAIPGPRLN